jgi:hypothetical protein
MRLTKRTIRALSVAAIALLVSGCPDPLTRSLRHYGFAPAIPSPATLHIGNLYDTADLKNPYALMRDMFSLTENEVLMTSLKDDVSIPDVSGEDSFSISAQADIVGRAKVELAAHRITKFKVTFGGVSQYLISRNRFEEELYPKIHAKIPDRKLDKKFAVVALLQVSSLQYEFMDESGGKVGVSPGGELEKVLKAKIGAEWSANERHNLAITSPRFIGYRMNEITETSFKLPKGADGTRATIQEIPLDDLRNAAR